MSIIQRRPFLPALTFTLLVLATGPAAAAAQAPPDPLERGDYAPASIDQAKLGVIPLQEPQSSGGAATGANSQINLEIRGAMYYPQNRPEISPLIMLVHGNHASCDVGTAPDCTIFKRNDQGYAYLAENLATWGYTVFSLDQDQLIARQDQPKGKGMHQRRLLITAALDAFYTANQPGGLPTGPNSNLGTQFVGKLDLDRIGMMGHSRGGDAVTNFLDFNRMRPEGRRYPIRGVISLAPTDYERKAPYGTPFMAIAPFCDGDVSNLQGARTYERSQYIKGDDPFPRILSSQLGGNHNFYNTVWTADNDDAGTATDSACGPNSPNNSRLSGQATPISYLMNNADKDNPEINTRISGDPARMGDQQKIGLATMAAFFRRYVGGEGAFDPYMTGELSLADDHRQIPGSACPTSDSGVRMDCDERVSTSYFAPPDERLDVIRPETDDPTGLSALGTKISASGLANPFTDAGGVQPKPATTTSGLDWCNPEPIHFAPGQLGIAGNAVANRACPLPGAAAVGGQNGTRENAPANHSYGRQLAVAWENPMSAAGGGPATITTAIPAASGDVSGFEALAMGAEVNFFDPRNPARSGNAEFNPELTTQDFSIALTDAEGNEGVISAADPDYGNALHQTTGNSTPHVHIVLDGIRVPLADFADQGVELTALRELELRFGEAGMPQTGSIQLADIRFQEALGNPTVLVDSMAPNAGPGTGPVASGPSPAAELAGFDPSRGSVRLPDTVGVGDSASTWTVDDDKVECPSASYSSIQAAVNQAAPWDTIVVCPGLYEESSTPVNQASNPVAAGSMNGLTITKPLKIKGAGADVVTITPDPAIGQSLAGSNPYLRDGGGNVITISRQSLGSTDDNEEFVDISGVTISSPDVYAEAGVSFFNSSGRISNSVVGPLKRVASAGELAARPHGWGVIATNTLIGVGSGTVKRQVTIDDSKVSGYQTGGILIDGARGQDGAADNEVRQGIRQFGYVTDSVVAGGTSSVFPQTGVKYASGARGFVTRNRITGNFLASDQRRSVGILLTDASTEVAGTQGFAPITGNIITGNGYGVFNANATDTAVRDGAPVTATGNFWGGSAPVEGPSQPGSEGISENDGAAADSVNVGSFLTTAPLLPSDFTAIADDLPSGVIVDPADGVEVDPLTELKPIVAASDDFAVGAVSLSADGADLGTDAAAPYAFSFTPTEAQAGGTVSLQATVMDSSGQKATTEEVDVVVTSDAVDPAPAPTPTPVDPDPAAPADPGSPSAAAPTLKLTRLSKDRARGTAILTAEVGGPGTLFLSGSGIRSRTVKAATGGSFDLPIRPRGKLRRQLRTSGRITARIDVAYEPAAGRTLKRTRRVVLIRTAGK